MDSNNIYAHGKLLITGEYFVLDGAIALAVPCLYGQELFIGTTDHNDQLKWTSKGVNNQVWFTASWILNDNAFQLIQTNDHAVSQKLELIFSSGIEQNKDIFQILKGKEITTSLSFPREWGLGTSSTLISLLAQYWNINPYTLLSNTFGGSGYDIACATANGPILYQKKGDHVSSENVKWNPNFKDHIYFAYQGRKQNSREGIKHYRSKISSSTPLINEINDLTAALLQVHNLNDAAKIIKEHEEIVSKATQLPIIKETRFKDFPGEVKSLGAWGGDFVMVLSPWDKTKTTAYFNTKGCPVVIPFNEMVKT